MTGKHEIEGSEGNRRQLQGLPAIRRERGFGIRSAGASATGYALRPRRERSRNRQLRGERRRNYDTCMAEWLKNASGRIGGDGEHRSLLDCSARGVGSARSASAASGYTATGAGAPGATTRATRQTANGFNACIAAACHGVVSGRRKRSACCGRWCGTRPTW